MLNSHYAFERLNEAREWGGWKLFCFIVQPQIKRHLKKKKIHFVVGDTWLSTLFVENSIFKCEIGKICARTRKSNQLNRAADLIVPTNGTNSEISFSSLFYSLRGWLLLRSNISGEYMHNLCKVNRQNCFQDIVRQWWCVMKCDATNNENHKYN